MAKSFEAQPGDKHESELKPAKIKIVPNFFY
jgi:hypothetical protein